MGSRRRASITSCWNASKSAFLRKRCIPPTDQFRTWYTCPSCAFLAASPLCAVKGGVSQWVQAPPGQLSRSGRKLSERRRR
jgi:hypothetical protein